MEELPTRRYDGRRRFRAWIPSQKSRPHLRVRWSTTFVCHRVVPGVKVTVAERALPVMCSRHVKTFHAREAAQPKFTR
jgi:hypothetical protein